MKSIEILGHKDEPGIDILSIIRKHQLPEAFPEEVMEEAEKAPDSITDEEIVQQGRRDLRGLNIVTIDGEDAKDLDDAVNVEKLPNGNYRLGCSYCRRWLLCAGEFEAGSGSLQPWMQCVSGGPGYSDAATASVQRDL